LVTDFGTSDVQSATVKSYKRLVGNDFSKVYDVLEAPSITMIDGQKAGAFLFTVQDKYGEKPVAFTMQAWISFIGNNSYLFLFVSIVDSYHNAETTEIRDNFIQSIRFLGINNTTRTS
jgi:hypothetical protein